MRADALDDEHEQGEDDPASKLGDFEDVFKTADHKVCSFAAEALPMTQRRYDANP
jgi:hypothetical protein